MSAAADLTVLLIAPTCSKMAAVLEPDPDGPVPLFGSEGAPEVAIYQAVERGRYEYAT